MTIQTIPVLISYAFPKAFNSANVTSGFWSTGIYPINRNAIPPKGYLPSFTTDSHAPPEQPNAAAANHTAPSEKTNSNTSANSPVPSAGSSAATHGDQWLTSPEEARPFGKAAPRKPDQQSRKRKSLVYTSAPVKKGTWGRQRKKGAPRMVTKTYRKKVAVAEDSCPESGGDDNISLESENMTLRLFVP